MGQILKDYPFTIALAFVAAGGASWIGTSVVRLVVALILGAVVGGAIDYSRKENRTRV